MSKATTGVAKPAAPAVKPPTVTAPTVNPPTVPADQTPPDVKGKKKRGKREPLQEVFDTAQAAVDAAQSREKGPRRAFTVKDHTGKEWYVVHNNEGRAAGVVGLKLGFEVDEIGKAKKAKALSPDGLLTAVAAMQDGAEKDALKEKLKALLGL